MKPIDPERIAKTREFFFLNPTCTDKEAADHAGISLATFKRIKQRQRWQELKDSQTTPFGSISGGKNRPKELSLEDWEKLLADAIGALSTNIQSTPARSLEGAASSLARLLDLYRKFHPFTPREVAQMCLSIPNFDFKEFGNVLRELTEAQKAA